MTNISGYTKATFFILSTVFFFYTTDILPIQIIIAIIHVLGAEVTVIAESSRKHI